MLNFYLEKGGSIVLMTSYDSPEKLPNLLSVTASMGLTLEEGITLAGDRNMRLSRYPYYIIPEIGSHAITDSLNSAGYYVLSPLAEPIAAVEGSRAEIIWLLTTSGSVYAKLAGLEMTTSSKEDGAAWQKADEAAFPVDQEAVHALTDSLLGLPGRSQNGWDHRAR